MAIKVGSKVRVRNLKEFDHNDGPDIVEDMYEYIGNEYEVSEERYDEGCGGQLFCLEGVETYSPFKELFTGDGTHQYTFLPKWLEEVA